MLLAIYYKGIIFLLKKLMKKTIITTSILALLSSSLTFAVTNITTGGEYNYPNSSDMGYINMTGQTISNSNFEGATFTSSDSHGIRVLGSSSNNNVVAPGEISNTSFAGAKFNMENGKRFISTGPNLPTAPATAVYFNNVDFSNTQITTGNEYVVSMYNTTWNNVSFNGAKFNLTSTESVVLFWFSTAHLTSIDMRNMQINHLNGKSVDIAVSGNQWQWSVLMDVDFRNTTINGEKISSDVFFYSDTGWRTEIKNVIMGDGTILSIDANWVGSEEYGKLNMPEEGLSLKEKSDILTIRGGTVILDKTSTATAGKIVFEDDAQLSIADNTTLTLTDDIAFVVEGDSVSASDILSLGNNSTIVMAGYSDEEAQTAFANLFKDSNGNSVSISGLESVNITGGPAVPEPSTYAAIFGAIALGFVAYRRRK